MGFSGVTLMVILYAGIIILWIGIWHYFLWREIRLSLFQVVTDMAPFMLIAVIAIFGAYYSTLWTDNAYILLSLRIIIAAAIYIGILWILGANILKESLSYLKKK
jgi:hypothetical protein